MSDRAQPRNRLSRRGSQITAHFGLGSDVINDDSKIISSFVGGGSSFATVSEEPDSFIYRAGVGLSLMPVDRMLINVSYEFEGRTDFTNQLFTATLRWSL